MSINVNGAPVVSIPIAICLFFVMYPIMVKMPFCLDLPVGAEHGAGTVILQDGIKMLEIPLWRSYFAGCILLGIAPCTAIMLFGLSSGAAQNKRNHNSLNQYDLI